MNIAMVVMSEQAAVSASVGSVFRDANDAADRRGLPFPRRAPCRITHGSELSADRSRDGATLLLNGASALQPVCTPLASELGPDGSNRPGPFREPASRASQPILGEADDFIAAHLLPCVRVRGGRFLPSAALPDLLHPLEASQGLVSGKTKNDPVVGVRAHGQQEATAWIVKPSSRRCQIIIRSTE